ncbi:MAG: TetR/AcrR family transcriptional regulator [Saprospiraceae bacterium]|nr:TetR/AcrR family transcriptional regulator [Candidatus Opimibacter skivensis]
MGINERKERERDAVKDLILSAAREIFLAEGYENTSIRKIATKIEYSPGIIYNHFKDKNDLLLALHDKAFECKIEALFLSVQNMPDPLERLKATGRGYIQYGIDNPQDYELMFILSCTMEALAVKEEFWQDGAMAINMLKQNIVECMEAGYFRKDINPDEISLILWSQVHGLVSLHNKERLNIYAMEDQKAFMFRSYDVFLSMIQKSLS